jgi:hypothetical protein
MVRTKTLVLGLLLVAVVVGLEEWRLAGSRKQISQLKEELAKAEAAIPPPPRPVPPGENPEKLLSRTKSRQASESKTADAGTAPSSSENTAPPSEETASNPAPEPNTPGEPIATPEPEPAPANATPPDAGQLQIRGRANQALRNSIVKQYANLIEKFQFNNVEAGYFVDLLVEEALLRRQFAAELGNAQTDAEQASIQARARQSSTDIANRMRDFLGNDRDFAIFQEYRRLLNQSVPGQ